MHNLQLNMEIGDLTESNPKLKLAAVWGQLSDGVATLTVRNMILYRNYVI
jgi:hypothetical protein